MRVSTVRHEEVGRKVVGSLLEQQKSGGEATHRDAVQERLSNDGGGAFEGEKRQKGMREISGGSDFHVTDAACGVPV